MERSFIVFIEKSINLFDFLFEFMLFYRKYKEYDHIFCFFVAFLFKNIEFLVIFLDN